MKKLAIALIVTQATAERKPEHDQECYVTEGDGIKWLCCEICEPLD